MDERSPSPDASLEARFREAMRESRRTLMVESAASACLLAAGATISIARPSASNVALSLFLAAFAAAWFVSHVRQHRSAAQGPGETPRAALRRRAERRFAAATSWWGEAAFVGFCAAWIPWMIATHAQAYAAQPARLAVGIGGILALLALIAVSKRRRAAAWKRERELLDTRAAGSPQ